MAGFDAYAHLNLQPNPDGTITRLLQFPTAKTNDDPNTGEPVLSKDVIINPKTNIKIRLYLPIEKIPKDKKIPIVFYFYGCNWVQFSGDNPALHKDRQWTAANLPALLIIVFYRLAPDCKIPGQFQDATDSILWLKKQASDPGGDKWIRDYGDPNLCFLHGSNNGGNIVFNTALRLLDTDLTPLKFLGLILNQPLFGGEERTESELRFATDQVIPLPALDLIWELALPKGIDKDHRYCNPVREGPHQDDMKLLPPCLILGYETDPLIDRYRMVVECLIKNGVEVEAHFSEFGFHRIEIVDGNRRVEMLALIKMFVRSKVLAESQRATCLDQETSVGSDEIGQKAIVGHDRDQDSGSGQDQTENK